eukprot:g1437.t1
MLRILHRYDYDSNSYVLSSRRSRAANYSPEKGTILPLKTMKTNLDSVSVLNKPLPTRSKRGGHPNGQAPMERLGSGYASGREPPLYVGLHSAQVEVGKEKETSTSFLLPSHTNNRKHSDAIQGLFGAIATEQPVSKESKEMPNRSLLLPSPLPPSPLPPSPLPPLPKVSKNKDDYLNNTPGQGQIIYPNVTVSDVRLDPAYKTYFGKPAGLFITEVRGAAVLLRTKTAYEGAKSACDKGDYWFDKANCNRIDVSNKVPKAVREGLEVLGESVHYAKLAANVNLNHTVVVDAEETAEGLMRNSTNILKNAEKGAGKCVRQKATLYPSAQSNASGWASLKAAVASRQAYALCADHGGGHNDQNDLEALQRAESEALLYQAQATRDEAKKEIKKEIKEAENERERQKGKEALEEFSDDQARKYDGKNGFEICEEEVCKNDRPATPKLQGILPETENPFRPHPSNSITYSGCLHGCAGSLEGVEERRLNQVIMNGSAISKHSTCSAYCTGVVGQPSVVEALKWAEKKTDIVTKEEERWVGACLRGCAGGYARRPGCKLTGPKGTQVFCE